MGVMKFNFKFFPLYMYILNIKLCQDWLSGT